VCVLATSGLSGYALAFVFCLLFCYSWFVIIGEIIEAIVGSIAMAIFSILDAFK